MKVHEFHTLVYNVLFRPEEETEEDLPLDIWVARLHASSSPATFHSLCEKRERERAEALKLFLQELEASGAPSAEGSAESVAVAMATKDTLVPEWVRLRPVLRPNGDEPR